MNVKASRLKTVIPNIWKTLGIAYIEIKLSD